MQTFNLVNFRQLGGLETRAGKKIRSNRLLRSGEVVNVSEQTATTLYQKYELRKIVDLRGEEEIKERPDDQLNGVSYEWIDIMKDVSSETGLADLKQMTQADLADCYMKDVYKTFVLNQGAQAGYQRYFQELLTLKEGALLFHCFAGKDRTGIAAALTLEMLDVPRELIYADYLKTNEMRKAANLALLEAERKAGASPEKLAAMEVGLQVKAEYLDNAYTVIEKNYGTIAQYAQEVLNIGNPEREELHALYVE